MNFGGTPRPAVLTPAQKFAQLWPKERKKALAYVITGLGVCYLSYRRNTKPWYKFWSEFATQKRSLDEGGQQWLEQAFQEFVVHDQDYGLVVQALRKAVAAERVATVIGHTVGAAYGYFGLHWMNTLGITKLMRVGLGSLMFGCAFHYLVPTGILIMYQTPTLIKANDQFVKYLKYKEGKLNDKDLAVRYQALSHLRRTNAARVLQHNAPAVSPASAVVSAAPTHPTSLPSSSPSSPSSSPSSPSTSSPSSPSS